MCEGGGSGGRFGQRKEKQRKRRGALDKERTIHMVVFSLWCFFWSIVRVNVVAFNFKSFSSFARLFCWIDDFLGPPFF